LYEKISNSKIDESCSLKSCGNSLETTFVLRLFKILSSDGCASASKIEKMAKKLKILVFFWDFELNLCLNSYNYSLLVASCNFLQEKNYFGHTLVGILTRKLDQKWRLFAKEKFHEKQTLKWLFLFFLNRLVAEILICCRYKTIIKVKIK
jgi:hypothetical protein